MIISEPPVEFTPSGFDFEFAAPSDYARLYRLRGIQVVPAFMPGEPPEGQSWKRPLLKTWTEYQEALIPDELFEHWYGSGEQFVARKNMGALTGRASNNLLVIDLDDYKNLGAKEWWENLIRDENNRIEPETVEQRTGGGGRQKIFRAPSGWVVPNKNIHSMGIDIKGQGGFVMLPPSLHESGKHYEWAEGQSPDDIPIAAAEPWLIEAVEKLVAEHGGTPAPPRKTNGQAPHSEQDAFGHLVDGRETYMRDMVWRVVLDWSEACPIKPPATDSARKASQEYEVYEREVSPQQEHPADLSKTQMLDREGRGWAAWWVKWQAAMRKWDDEVYTEARRKDRPRGEDVSRAEDFTKEYAKTEQQAKATGQIMEYLDVRQIKAQPDPVWLIEDLINEQSLGFIFGPPGSLKTFVSLDIALSITTGQPAWWGRAINRRGAVIYLCREGIASLKFRIMAWEQHRGTAADDAPFFLIRQPMNFMNGADIGLLLATVEDVAMRAKVPIAAIFVDTVSRVLPGAKENQQEDMSLFVGGCEMLQQRFQCIVAGVHHTNKNGTIRGSTVIPGAGDFLIETRREPGAMTGSIVLQKVKDGEDGQELPFKVTKIDLGGIVPRTSLAVDPDGVAKASAQPSSEGLPDIIVCREILAALAQAWFNKMPWGKGANSDRPALIMIMNRWMLKREMAKRLMEGWLANGVIEYDYFDKRNKLRGYRKIVDL